MRLAPITYKFLTVPYVRRLTRLIARLSANNFANNKDSSVARPKVKPKAKAWRLRPAVTCLAVLLLVGSLAPIPDSAFAQGPKIGYVNAVKLIEAAPQGEMALKTLEAEFSPREQELREIRERIRDLEDKLEKDSLVMKDSERRDRENEIRDMQRTQKRSAQEMREDYNLRRNEELADLQRVVTKAIVEIAKAENYDLILQDSVYVSPKLDITDKVLEKLRSTAGN